MTSDAVSNLLGHFTLNWGREFVAHLLACDASELNNLALTPERMKVVTKLHNLMSGGGIAPAFSQHRALSVAHLLVRYDRDLQSTPATSFHLLCGGTIPAFEGDDAPEHSLLRLATDAAFPALLVEESEHVVSNTQVFAMAAISSHPAQADFVRSLQNQLEPLRNLFDGRLPTDESEWRYETVRDIDTYFTWSDGSVGHVTVGGLSTSILFATSTTMANANLLSSYLTAVRQALALARAMASFARSRAIAHVGLSGISLSEEVDTVNLPSGKLRRSTAIDTAMRHSFEKPIWLGIDPHHTILEIGIDLKLEEATGTRWKGQVLDNPQLRTKIDLLRLAILLSSDDDTLISPVLEYAFVNIPISSGTSYTMNPFRWPFSSRNSFTIDADTVSRIEQWSRQIEQLPPSLSLGMRRLLSAATNRIDPLDSLVDAVIAWENLFGTDSGETSFRVCGALAHVLEPKDAAKRKDLFREAKQLYNVRSRLVHGSKEPHQDEAERYADRAIQLAVQSYRAVFLRTDLLNAPNSSARSELILIGY